MHPRGSRLSGLSQEWEAICQPSDFPSNMLTMGHGVLFFESFGSPVTGVPQLSVLVLVNHQKIKLWLSSCPLELLGPTSFSHLFSHSLCFQPPESLPCRVHNPPPLSSFPRLFLIDPLPPRHPLHFAVSLPCGLFVGHLST